MALITWQTLQILENLYQQIETQTTELLEATYQSTIWVSSNESSWVPSIQVQETDAELVMQIEIPEALQKNLEVHITPETAVLKSNQDEVAGYFTSGYIQNIIPLPIPVHPEAVSIVLNGQWLVLKLPKSARTQRQGIRVNFSQDTTVPQQSLVSLGQTL